MLKLDAPLAGALNSEEYPQPWLYADGTRIRGGELQADNVLAPLLSLEDDEQDEQWAQLVDEDPDRIAEDVWYVQYGPAAEDVCRWHNADFIAIPWRDGAMSEALEPPPNF